MWRCLFVSSKGIIVTKEVLRSVTVTMGRADQVDNDKGRESQKFDRGQGKASKTRQGKQDKARQG